MDWQKRREQAVMNVAFFQGQIALCDEAMKEAAPERPVPRLHDPVEDNEEPVRLHLARP